MGSHSPLAVPYHPRCPRGFKKALNLGPMMLGDADLVEFCRISVGFSVANCEECAIDTVQYPRPVFVIPGMGYTRQNRYPFRRREIDILSVIDIISASDIVFTMNLPCEPSDLAISFIGK